METYRWKHIRPIFGVCLLYCYTVILPLDPQAMASRVIEEARHSLFSSGCDIAAVEMATTTHQVANIKETELVQRIFFWIFECVRSLTVAFGNVCHHQVKKHRLESGPSLENWKLKCVQSDLTL